MNVITATLVDLGPDVSLCQGENVLLDATTAGATYLWSTGAITPTITTATSGTYWVQAIQGICTTTDTITIRAATPMKTPSMVSAERILLRQIASAAAVITIQANGQDALDVAA